MTVCYFGSFDPEYSRNRILIDGLSKNGVDVIHCRDSSRTFLLRYPRLVWMFLQNGRRGDVILVGFRGHEDVPLAWFLGHLFNKPVVFDMFISLYDTYLNDREVVKEGSFGAWMFYWIDKLGCLLSDKVLLDTHAHIRYISRLLKIPKEKFFSIYVGGDDSLFRPKRKTKRKETVVEFHGSGTRLQGGSVILSAAHALKIEKRIRFHLIGESVQSPCLPPKELAAVVADSDITIGHMGTTKKAHVVISNKIFHGLAVGNAVVVQDSPAARELLRDGENCLFVRAGDARDLAEKILFLVRNPVKRRKIARAGYTLFQKKLTNVLLGQELLKVLSPIV